MDRMIRKNFSNGHASVELVEEYREIFQLLSTPRVECTDRERLSLFDIQQKKLRCKLAFIFSCWGADSRRDSRSDDSFGTGTSFTVARSKYVTCTLWTINQVAGMSISLRFYKNLDDWKQNGRRSRFRSISACLLDAQNW